MLLEGGKMGGVLPETWNPITDGRLPEEVHYKFKGELYGILVSLTSGKPRMC